ncbi:Pseudouridine-5'-phosphate_glycosidase [Hexamita inflata]|uniref:Pseudouridine-5'-phosphate glycosidase n=1 Tax=Hexamita inflata TaxID=28002 RepID=A0AA86TWV8_9EUKA|nr:Pseudouridine-5'-phosphate glycosidase [Hexamita inflata]
MKTKHCLNMLSLVIVYLIVTFAVFTPKSLLMKQIAVSDKVLLQLSKNLPILGLESTIITHGLPYPTNVETQLKLEQISLENGALPATIAIINGMPTIGLTPEQIEELGKSETALKASVHDIQFAKAMNRTASTTVAATSRLAEQAHINVFSTGGIGGVHRFQDQFEFDVSADLTELGKTDVLVISAGCKAILDLQGTVEVLETNQVLTVGFGVKEMPAFYSRSSGIKLDYMINTAQEAAQIYDAGINQRGYLLFNPIPQEFEIKKEEIEPEILKVLANMPKSVKGKAVTPYLLKAMSEITGNRSIVANLALIENNVRVGAKIANEIKQIEGFNMFKNPVFFVCGQYAIHELQEVLISLVLGLVLVKIAKCACKNKKPCANKQCCRMQENSVKV